MDRPIPWWLRVYLLIGAFQAGALGVTGLLSPAAIQVPLRMSPLNARFVAALYLTSALAIFIPALGRSLRDAWLFAVGFTVGAVVITFEILLRWGDYMAAGLPHRPAFFGVYIVDLALAAYVIPAAGFLTIPSRQWHRLSGLFLAESITLAVAGVGLLMAPRALAHIWPWTLPPVLSQLYAAFFLALALGAFLVSGESRPIPIRTFSFTSMMLTLLVLIASLLHLPKFKSGPETWVWFATFSIGLILFGAAFASTIVSRPVAPTALTPS